MVDIRTIKKLIELIDKTGVSEIEVKSGEDSVRISKQMQTTVVAQAPVAVAGQPVAAPVTGVAAVESSVAVEAKQDGYTLSSPMVGTVYLASSPGAKPMVEVGQRVEVGDTVCLIEAMKMFNAIEADRAGVISARLIENEQPVEFGQPLYIIDTDGE